MCVCVCVCVCIILINKIVFFLSFYTRNKQHFSKGCAGHPTNRSKSTVKSVLFYIRKAAVCYFHVPLDHRVSDIELESLLPLPVASPVSTTDMRPNKVETCDIALVVLNSNSEEM